MDDPAYPTLRGGLDPAARARYDGLLAGLGPEARRLGRTLPPASRTMASAAAECVATDLAEALANGAERTLVAGATPDGRRAAVETFADRSAALTITADGGATATGRTVELTFATEHGPAQLVELIGTLTELVHAGLTADPDEELAGSITEEAA